MKEFTYTCKCSFENKINYKFYRITPESRAKVFRALVDVLRQHGSLPLAVLRW